MLLTPSISVLSKQDVRYVNTMLLRIFSSQEHAQTLVKYENILKKEYPGLTIQYCNTVRWLPTTNADIHLYVDVPVRLGVPFARYNVWAKPSDVNPGWSVWCDKEMQMTVRLTELMTRTTALETFRRIFRFAARDSHDLILRIPVDPKLASSPVVGVITVTRNRKGWWPNMIQNVFKQTWFKENPGKVEWLIVDDSDAGQGIDEEVDDLRKTLPAFRIQYKRIKDAISIGAKRNLAVESANPDVSLFVVMDDDDHYPPTSIQERVNWLTTQSSQPGLPGVGTYPSIVYCATIPMYDLTRYISAMNVPEMGTREEHRTSEGVGPAYRVSEATLGFTREAWVTRPFLDIQMGEGAGFMLGREEESVEINPTNVIVSFIHTKNTSSRRVPAAQEPNGCHYGFSDSFFKYLHEVGNA